MDGQTQCQLSVIRARESDKCWPRACKLAFTLTIILVLVVLLEYTAMMMMHGARPATRPDREHTHKKNAKAKVQQKKDLLHLHGSIDRRIQSVSTTALWLQLLLPIKIAGKNPINIILRNFDLEFV